ncbi:hypothetical protein GCM10010172_78820 [Paractinoplanes ferrugineus]|uniref:PknH-like extracellular domain-containing protein n=1 Tax=Paractinoplanes ferrugineus TaxID=113564 RepID=A0A919J1V4_9ACTN|nr:hypothetical protein [Actinoplanes ferrugineus]GIE12955.1 hypothetical protein Afe05nite_47950 [Actinoplanes ferrugineus]
MFVTGRVAITAACVLALAAGCSSDDGEKPDDSLISETTMRGALLQATDVGPTWRAPDESADPNQLVSICGGSTPPPTVPPGASVVAAPLADEGEKGAQTLEQIALVYGDKSGADAALAGLKAVADGCPANQSVAAVSNDQRNEPAYTETVQQQTVNEQGWSGFVVIRHKKYEASHPGTADTAVTIVQRANVVLVDAYALYQLSDASAAPQFDADWKKLVGSVVQRVG